jgi:hypothetical protein
MGKQLGCSREKLSGSQLEYFMDYYLVNFLKYRKDCLWEKSLD